MDPNQNWYNPPQHQYHNGGQHSRGQSPNINSRGFANAASQSVQNAQQLLASYPMASVGPTVHGTCTYMLCFSIVLNSGS
jgi:cohesin loading factor subunit SCC2